MNKSSAILGGSLLLACSSSHPPESVGLVPALKPDAAVTLIPELPTDAGPLPDLAPEPRTFTASEVFDVLFAGENGAAAARTECAPSMPPDARVRCFFDVRYRGDRAAANVAHELLVKWQIVAGVEVAHTMNGGYRGMIRLEPAVPLGAERKQLEWIASAFRDIDEVFAGLGSAPGSKRYRFRPLELRFVRSVGARTPSAYAHDWTVAWNLAGSLHRSPDAVRETMVHEIFHLNDFAHASADGGSWSQTALSSIFDAISKKCGTKIPCLAPYSPNDTIVRGGTYYSFQPGNGVGEYAAELALRYFRETRDALRGRSIPKPFKCGPSENDRAWSLMRDEFWDGIDRVPPCRPTP